MAQPKTFGATIQAIRWALYEMAKTPRGSPDGFLEAEVLNYLQAHRGVMPVRDFDHAMTRLLASGEVDQVPQVLFGQRDALKTRYAISGHGKLREEQTRLGYRSELWSELRKPVRIANVVWLVIGSIATLLITYLAGALHVPRP